jgi:hypothetical protein
MMRKILAVLGLTLMLGASEAKAQSPSYEIAYTTFSNYGMFVTSGTAKEITALPHSGFTGIRAGYRIRNQGASTVWLGGVSVSTRTAAGSTVAVMNLLGEELRSGESVVWMSGRHGRTDLLNKIYAIAADGAGTTQVPLSIVLFGY